MKHILHALLLAPVLSLGLATSASAIVVNGNFGAAGAAAYGAGFSSVVQMFRNGSSWCSGSVISATAILTAQHCTFNRAASDFSVGFDQNGDGTFDSTATVDTKYEFDATNSLVDGTDVAILTLAAGLMPVWATPIDLWAGDPLGELVTMVGFGRRGVESVGFSSPLAVRWAADNVVDTVGAAPPGGFGANIISTDFDNGTNAANTLAAFGSSATPLAREGTTAGGDSGGPLLVDLGDRYAISGVLSGGSRADSGFGDISWWTGIARYRTVIESYGGRFVDRITQVPEPGSLALVLAALLGVGVVAAQRRRAG